MDVWSILVSVTEVSDRDQAEGPCPGDLGPFDPENRGPGADARLGHRGADPADFR
jgi:hypothetical protein